MVKACLHDATKTCDIRQNRSLCKQAYCDMQLPQESWNNLTIMHQDLVQTYYVKILNCKYPIYCHDQHKKGLWEEFSIEVISIIIMTSFC